MTNPSVHITKTRPLAAIIGGGPAGLMAAEMLAPHAEVHVFDAMPSLARKFLLAGKSGLNITHGEALDIFLTRFGKARDMLEPALRDFGPHEVREWVTALGIDTFEGSSGRIFPVVMKASPLLRAWLKRLSEAGVQFHSRHKWQGWSDEGALLLDTPEGQRTIQPEVTVLAMGGASWPRLGSDGGWTAVLQNKGISIHPLAPANCGFDVNWSEHISGHHAGTPVKSVVLRHGSFSVKGDFVITQKGVEGSAIYALSSALRDTIDAQGHAALLLDLAPDRDEARLTEAFARPRKKASMATYLRKVASISGVKAALLREAAHPLPQDAGALARIIKNLPIRLERPRPIAEAISSAGGIERDELDTYFMLKKMPGIFVAGEMLDWDAPTGGYLLTACLSTGRKAGEGAALYLTQP